MQVREQTEGASSQIRGAVWRDAWKVAALVFAIGIPLGWATVGAGLFALIAPLLIHEARKQGARAWGRLWGPLAAFVAVSALSALLGEARTDGLLFSLAVLLLGGASLLGGRRVARDPGFFQRVFLPALVISAAGIAVYVLYQSFGLGMARAPGLDAYVNRMGTLLMVSGVLGIGYLLSLKGRWRWSAIPYAALVGTAMIGTLSRGAWIAGMVGALILALRWPRRGLVVLLIAAMAGGTLLASQPSWQNRFLSTFSVERNMDRLAMWDAAVEIFLDHPVLGAGPTSFPVVGPDYVERPNWQPHATPHNVVLSIAAGMGVAGLLVLGWLTAQAGRLGLALWRRGDPISLAIVAGILALFVNDLFAQGFYTSQVGAVFWFALGTLEGRAEVQGE